MKPALSAVIIPTLATGIAFLVLPLAIGAVDTNTPAPQIRFLPVDIYVDSKSTPLAAYQLKFWSSGGGTKIVGIEGGEHPAFKEPPYYDPKAMEQDRVILAAFNTAKKSELPRGKTRVATLHLQIRSQKMPEFFLKLQTAANSEGKRIPAEAAFEERKPIK